VVQFLYILMTFDIITIFPNIFDSYFKESIIRRAQERKIVKINIRNLRDYTKDKHKTVDDKPYGGGPGMILKVEPIFKAVKNVRIVGDVGDVKKTSLTKTILLSAKGKKFDQKMAYRFSKLDRIILICGRYEGVDERVAQHIADEEISIGDYILTGGELPAMIVVDAISRLMPGVIKEDSLREETFSFKNKREKLEIKIEKEYPQYTRPEVFRGWRTPKTLLSGNHKKIEEWKKKHRG